MCYIALGRFSCCGARAQASETQRAALHVTHTAAGCTAGKRQLASRRVISHVTSPDLVSRVSSASCKPLLPTVMQDMLHTDGLDAALEETKAQVEKCSTVDG